MTEAPKIRANAVLIVDDMPGNLHVLLEFLDRTGHEVLVAESGESALHQLAFITPGIILLDVLMPGLGGFETCRRIKATPRLVDVPVFFMSAQTELVDKLEGFAAGAVDYITKPLFPSEVLARIRTHLKIRELQAALARQNTALGEEVALRQSAEAQLAHSLDRAVLVLDAGGHVQFASQLARLVLARWWGGDPASAEVGVPAALAAWIESARRGDAGAPDVWRHEALGGRVEARLFAPRAAGDGAMVLLDERPDASPAALERLGLSPREAEVLYWLSEGKSYKEIAVILACESRTAQKHAQRIFEKLAVENRHGAANIAREALARG